jgi:hypothetical protein
MTNNLDREGLTDIFEMAEVQPTVMDPVDEFSDAISNIDFNTDRVDPKVALEENIEKANNILDLVIAEVANGNFSARLVEVAGQIINSITNASKEMITGSHNVAYLQLREKMLELKRVEIEMKKTKSQRPTNQNIIISDRESILKFLDNDVENSNEKGREENDG